jgi:chromosomal replication initiation ATPase DnaA
LAYFPNAAFRVTNPGALYGSSDHTSIYSIHIRQIIEHCVTSVYRISPFALRSRSRCPARVALARQMAMYLAHVACGLTLTEAGALFHRDRTTAAHGCGVVEDLRDDPVIDRTLMNLEAALAALSRSGVREAG